MTLCDSITFETSGPDETRTLGSSFARILTPGDFIALDGGLAAGKTCFVQGLAAGLDYHGSVTSPTFCLMHMYEGGRLPLCHFDLYRLESPDDLEGLGFDEYFYGDGVCVVEWGSLAADYLPDRRIGLVLERPDTNAVADADSYAVAEKRRIRATIYGGDDAWRKKWIAQLGAL